MHVRDVARANVAAAEDPAVVSVFNLGSAVRVTINWLAESVAEVAGTGVGISHGPQCPGDVRDRLADIENARAAFGYAPTVDLLDGLNEYLERLRPDPASSATRAAMS